MDIPSYDRFTEPILRYLAEHPGGASASEVHESTARALGISDEEKLEMLPSGIQPVYKNRAGWAHDRLKRAGLSSSPRRGYWKLTESGFQFVKSHPTTLSPAEIEKIAFAYTNVRLRSKSEADDASEHRLPLADGIQPPMVASPDERLDGALVELRSATAEDLLEAIGQASPKFFETLVLDLLHAMGYGASRADLQHVGRTGDGGIDGVISLDRLGLEKVFVQAKRWQGTVGREPVQAFYGALAGRRATKGVFITTSTVSSQALEFGRSIDKVVLVDGARLAELMMEFGIGVAHRTLKIPRIDHDYFEE